MSPFEDMFLRLLVVCVPTLTTAFALERAVVSESRNRWLYAGFATGSGLIGILSFADAILGLPLTRWSFLAALLTPLGWSLTRRLAWTGHRSVAYDQNMWSADILPRPRRSSQRKGAAPNTADHVTPSDAAVPVFRTSQRIRRPEWGAPMSSDFVPRSDRIH